MPDAVSIATMKPLSSIIQPSRNACKRLTWEILQYLDAHHLMSRASQPGADAGLAWPDLPSPKRSISCMRQHHNDKHTSGCHYQ